MIGPLFSIATVVISGMAWARQALENSGWLIGSEAIRGAHSRATGDGVTVPNENPTAWAAPMLQVARATTMLDVIANLLKKRATTALL
jgi:hypothetical protein